MVEIHIESNVVRNTLDLFNPDSKAKKPSLLLIGYIIKEIVTLVFSCLAAFLSMAVTE